MYSDIQIMNELNKQFQEAVLNNDLEKIKLLFSEDKKVHPYIDFEMIATTGILISAQNKNWEIVKELFNLGADLDAVIMPQKWHLVHECITNAPEKITEAIIENANINNQTKNGETPLMIAIKRDRIYAADLILKTGRADLSLYDKNHETAAHYAIKYKKYDFFLELIKHGIPLLRKNKDGKTAIDLIEDESFKMSLPVEFEKISNNKEIQENKPTEIKKEIPKTQKEVKQITGLSKITKK